MKLICLQDNLNQGLSIVSNITAKNINLPILNNVLIKAKNNVIKLSTTNLEIGINCLIRGKVEKEGVFTVPAKVFSDYVNLLTNNQVSIELIENELNIKTSNSKTRFKGNNPEEFPVIPELEKENIYTVSVKDFKEGVSGVIFAVALNNSRPEINGVVFDFDDKLTIAATDSYRLAEKKIPFKTSNKKKNKIIVPARTLQEILRVLSIVKNDLSSDKDSYINISISTDNQILFNFSDLNIGPENNIEIVSKLIEGKYPEYKEVIPTDINTDVVVDKNDLIKTIKKSSLFTKSGVDSIKISFLNKTNELTVFSANTETGENLSKIPITIKGDDNEITLNYRYLLDGLQHIEGDDVRILLVNKDTPCLLNSTKNKDYLYIIMPIRS